MQISSPKLTCYLPDKLVEGYHLGQHEGLLQSSHPELFHRPVAPFMDREKVTKPSAQIGFIKFVLIPMFETVAKVNNGGC